MLKVENLKKSFFTEEVETIALNGVSFATTKILMFTKDLSM